MKKLRTRFFLHSIIPTVVIYAVVVISGLIYVNRYYEREAITQKNSDVENISRAVNDWLIARISEVLQLSRIPSFQSGNEREIRRYLPVWRSHTAFIYSDVYFIKINGRYWGLDNKKGNLEGRVFLSKFIGNIPKYFFIGRIPGEACFKDSLVVAAPIFAGSKNSGVIAGVIPIDVINRMLGFFTFSGFDKYMLVDQFGTIIVHSNRKLYGKTEKEVYGQEFTKLTRYKDQMVFVNVLKTAWKFVTFQPVSVLMQPIKSVNRIVTAFLIILIGILLLVAYTTSSTVVRPIQKLTNGVEKIMAGDYGQHIDINSEDEMKILADSFNRLSERMVQIRTDDRFLFLGHIAARMAHEMRKPLHIIQLAVQTMKVKGEYTEKHLEIVINEIENADRFLREILNFARPDMLNLQEYSLSALWEKILDKYRLMGKEKNIMIEYIEKNESPPFYFDIIKIEEVFANLLQNAFEAIDENSDRDIFNERKIIIEQKYKQQQGIYVRITDTGPGFKKESIDRMFDPYFTTKNEGTGLGLAIAYRILSAHGAKIDLKNTVEGYGCVEILFPL
ncbi:MAG: sensor histidine kinase [Spirochaetales bacterium]|nr:sensor histidine kinase [Spirochaetales bacterium]